jgi:hypothetical protein
MGGLVMRASNTRHGALRQLEPDQEESMTTAKPTKATAKPAKATAKPTNATAKADKPAAKRTRPTKRKIALSTPSHGEIAERAYFIHLEASGSDQLANWLQAERELTAA